MKYALLPNASARKGCPPSWWGFAAFAIVLAAAGSSCSSRITLCVRPEGIASPAKVAEPLPCRVAVVVGEPMTDEGNPMVMGARADLTTEFVEALRGTGLFREVQYPLLSTHRFEMTLEVRQEGWEKQPWTTHLLILPTWATLNLIGPLFSYAQDSHVESVVTLKIRSDTVATYSAKTDVRLGYHYGWKNPDLSQGLRACIAANHRQLVAQIVADRDRLADLLAHAPGPPGR